MNNLRVVCSGVLALLPAVLGLSCVQRDWSVCSPQDPCQTGYTCTADWKCMLEFDGGVDAALAVDSPGASDGAIGTDRPAAPDAAVGPASSRDAGEPDIAPVSTPADAPVSVAPRLDGPEPDFAPVSSLPDAPADTRPDAPADAAPDAAVDAAFDAPASDVPADAPASGVFADAPAADALPTGPTVDAAGTCSTDKDCSPQNPLCLGNRCAKCSRDSDCAGRASTPACAIASGLCVACTQNTHCIGAARTCDTTTNQCVGCVTRSDCGGVCQTCSSSGMCTALKSQDDPGVCAGTCDSTGACKSKQGQPCQTAGGGCAAGTTCAPDGVCCDQECSSSCMACDIPGFLGICTPVASGAPHGNRTACTGTNATCAGSCTGLSDGQCTYPTSNCGSGPTCSGNNSVGQATCSNGSCLTPVAQACSGNFACVGTACKTSCSADSDCVSGYFCQENTCHLGARQVAVGETFSCALLSDGSVECWGRNQFGALGPAGPTSTAVIPRSNTPIKVTGLGSAKAISAGYNHVCALLTSGAVWCWGAGDSGQLGNGTIPSSGYSATPVLVSGLPNGVTAIAAGRDTSCALIGIGGAVYCWGSNISDELGAGSSANNSPSPLIVTGLSSASGVSTGNTTCAITFGGISCWGLNADAEAGQVVTGNGVVASPVPVGGISSVANAQAVSVGTYHTCAILSAGSVYCWGRNMYGQLGDASTLVDGHAASAVAVQGLSSGATQVSAGFGHTCALLATGRVWCWGVQRYGALGDGVSASDGYSQTPVVVGNVTGATNLSVNSLHSCAVVSNGLVKCWGEGADGELGNSAFADSAVAVNVTGW
jgi:alpha-tubulin suppressor-like RCC1 family protein